jgi:predicted dehydrogenase
MQAESLNTPIRVGIIGVGNWARYGHIPALRLLPDYRIVAVSSRRQATANQIAQDFNVAHAFDRWESLITHPEVDLVIVLPPAPEHEQVAKAAIAAGKDVYCEWPLTTSTEDSKQLLRLAEKAGIRHIVGLQRRLGPSALYLKELLASSYVGRLRSVRMHVSMEYFHQDRSPSLDWTIDPANFSHVLSIYGGHFLDMLFHIVGFPKTISGFVTSQFSTLFLSTTGDEFPNLTPDQVVAFGQLENDAVFTIQIEGGKRNNSGLQIDITGVDGDLKVSNEKSFGNLEDNKIEGAQGAQGFLKALSVPAQYHQLPESTLDVSVQDLANLYAAHSRDRRGNGREAPNFRDALRMHRLLDAIQLASSTGMRQGFVADEPGS